MAVAVVRELFEFGLGITAAETGDSMPLAPTRPRRHGSRMLFNTFGASIVATFGQTHLSGVAETVTEDCWQRIKNDLSYARSGPRVSS